MLDIEMTNKRFSLVQMFSLSRQEEKADLTGVASSKSTKKYTYNNQTYDYTGDDYYVEIKVSWVKKPVCVCVCVWGGGGGVGKWDGGYKGYTYNSRTYVCSDAGYYLDIKVSLEGVMRRWR